MVLQCGCDYFDPGEYDSWYEPGYKVTAKAGDVCGECGAPLTPGEVYSSVDLMEAYDPEEERPEYDEFEYPFRWWTADPEANAILEAEWDERYLPIILAIEKAQETWDEKYNWDSENERCVRPISTTVRCDRCDGIAAALEDMGYCMIGPDEVIDAHEEYVNDYGGGTKRVQWKRNELGVWNPEYTPRCEQNSL